jgi:uncharacterized protein (DUF952 family)
MLDLIYKIAPAALWREAQERGRFDGAPNDIEDGFIHFSTATQIGETAAKHFSGRDNLMLIAVDAKRLGDALRFKPSRGGALFPHLHAPLPLDAVVSAKPLPLGRGGRHDFSGLLDEPTPLKGPAAEAVIAPKLGRHP